MDINSFFSSVLPREFTQLRSEPLQTAYGRYITLDLVVLDLLADEVEVTQFGFPLTYTHQGFLFSKLFPDR
jgi:hypothetical protein